MEHPRLYIGFPTMLITSAGAEAMSYPWPFTFEGQFLGFVADHNGKLKYLNLGLPETHSVTIKLPKSARSPLRLSLTPGDAVKVRGMGKLDTRTGELKLKADLILPISLASANSCPLANEGSSVSSAPSLLPPKKIKAQILVCRKSGCLKRGGKELRQVLEQTICDRNWQDQVDLEWTGCLKRCSKAPNFVIRPGKECHNKVQPSVLAQLDHLLTENRFAKK
jgi:(2Fe-2S) ferredoxin